MDEGMKRKNRKLNITNNSDSKIYLVKSKRSRTRYLDFKTLDLPDALTNTLTVAFRSIYGKSTKGTQYVRFNTLKCFAQFCKESGISEAADLTTEAINRYVIWIKCKKRQDGNPLKLSTQFLIYSPIKCLLEWIKVNHPSELPHIDFPYSPFPNRTQSEEKTKPLTPEFITTLIKCCKRDTQENWERYKYAQQILEEASSNHPKGSLEWLMVEVDKYDGLIPIRTQLLRDKRSDIIYGMRKHGGKQELLSYLWPTTRTIFPYYLLILIHTAGNPEAVASFRRDCIRPIPLTSDQECVVWEKGRATQLQIRSFSTRDPYQPPNLIRQVKAMTEKLQHKFQSDDNRLFLYRSVNEGRVAKLVAISLKLTILPWWCRRHNLPEFSLNQIRTSVLNGVYRETGDIIAVKSTANHVSIRTTSEYLNHTINKERNKAVIAKVQVSYEKWLTQETAPILKTNGKKIKKFNHYKNATALGFMCKNPFEGIAPESKKGERCPAFTACFTCPNAVLLLNVETLSRLLQAKKHYLHYVRRIDRLRWEALYAPQLNIIDREILPRFEPELWEEAERLSKMLPSLPDLR